MFCLNYALVPLVSILLSWWVARCTDERMFIWAALIVLFVDLVNFSAVSEMLIALQLACPLMIACYLQARSHTLRILAAALGVLIFGLHPLSSLVFVAIAVGCLLAGNVGDTRRLDLRVTATILLAAAALRGLVSLWQINDYGRSVMQGEGLYEYLLLTSKENIFFLACAVVIGSIACCTRTGDGVSRSIFVLQSRPV